MPLWAAAYLNMFSIRQRARSQHSRPAPVALMSEVRTCRTTEPCSNRVSWRAGPYPLISTISSASITVTVVVERTTWDWWGSVVSSDRGARRSVTQWAPALWHAVNRLGPAPPRSTASRTGASGPRPARAPDRTHHRTPPIPGGPLHHDRHRDARRGDRRDQRVRPGPPTHPVRARLGGPAGPDLRHERHRRGPAVLATGPLADREHVQVRRRPQRHRHPRRLPHGHRTRPPQGHQPRPHRSPRHRSPGGSRTRRRRTRPAPTPRWPAHARPAERRPARSAPPDRDRHPRPGGREDRAAPHPRQDPGHRPGPRRETRPPPHRTPRPPNGPTPPRVQRRSVARRPPQRLPHRPRRIPRHRAPPTSPRWAGRLRHPRDHDHPGPTRQPPNRPRPRSADRGVQRHDSLTARRQPPTDLPTPDALNLNGQRVPT